MVGQPVYPGAEHCFAGTFAFQADLLVITSTEVCPSSILSFSRRFIGSHNCKLKAKNQWFLESNFAKIFDVCCFAQILSKGLKVGLRNVYLAAFEYF